jgi:hypothetical protein
MEYAVREYRSGQAMKTETAKQTLKREFWRPEDPRIWVRKQPRFGCGWAINFAAVARRLRGKR